MGRGVTFPMGTRAEDLEVATSIEQQQDGKADGVTVTADTGVSPSPELRLPTKGFRADLPPQVFPISKVTNVKKRQYWHKLTLQR